MANTTSTLTVDQVRAAVEAAFAAGQSVESLPADVLAYGENYARVYYGTCAHFASRTRTNWAGQQDYAGEAAYARATR